VRPHHIAFALLALIGCAPGTPSIGVAPITSVTLHGSEGAVQVRVEEADSPAERERGLMGRASLGADQGMVFVFEESPVTARFWMKDTLIPLSIAFWDADGSILTIRDMEPCPKDPCPTYGAPAPYVGALEVNQGFFDEHGIHVGDSIELS
jgi:uncharacterized membrane protein (UPF0127 family)